MGTCSSTSVDKSISKSRNTVKKNIENQPPLQQQDSDTKQEIDDALKRTETEESRNSSQSFNGSGPVYESLEGMKAFCGSFSRVLLESVPIDTKEVNTFALSPRAATEPTNTVPRVNQYTLGDVLGYGSQGVVRIATDPENRIWAMKIVKKRINLRRGKSKKDGIYGPARGKIAKEIAIMKKLKHPNIVVLHEILDSPDQNKIYIVMQHIDGGPIMNDTLEPQEPLEEMYAQSLFRQLIQGLEYLHHHGILHRDIKPSNLLVNKRGFLKISDFGVSSFCKPINDSESRLEDCENMETRDVQSKPAGITKTATESSLGSEMEHNDLLDSVDGTPAFLPPEACISSGEVLYHGKSADLWAAGITLYIFLFGKIPFYGETQFEIFNAIRENELEFPQNSCSPDVIRLLSKILVKDQTKRKTLSRIKKSKWVKRGGYKIGLSKIQEATINVTNDEMDEALTNIDLSIGVELLIRSKSWTLPARDDVSELSHLNAELNEQDDVIHNLSLNVADSTLATDAASYRPLSLPARKIREHDLQSALKKSQEPSHLSPLVDEDTETICSENTVATLESADLVMMQT